IWKGFTIDWYVQLFTGQTFAGLNPGVVWSSLWTSIKIATVATIASVVMGTLLALGLDRYRFTGQEALQGMIYLPVVIPGVVTGIASLLFFNYFDFSLGVGTAILSHSMFDISFVTIMVYARLQNFDRTLEEAARDLGAGYLETFHRVTLPLLFPAIVAGGLLAFIFSFENFVITFFVIGNDNTLPIFFFSMMRQGVTPGVNVVATLLMVVTMGLVVLAMRYERLY
ncbi:MAG: ABC transporter permease, partial [Halobacteriales archaeon]|nr:ABC transporter permease [Halobacteriales archaeon]